MPGAGVVHHIIRDACATSATEGHLPSIMKWHTKAG